MGFCAGLFRRTISGLCKNKPISQIGFSKALFHSSLVHRDQSKIEVDSILINYDKTGNGPLPVLCMPGALGFVESDFGPILPKFDSSKFTLITWDPPGFGKSRPPDRDFSGGKQYFHRDAEWANKLMNKLGYTTYSILGWSDGATTAMFIAFTNPDVVEKLVIWGGQAYISQGEMDFYKFISNFDNWSENMKAPLLKMYGEKYLKWAWVEGIMGQLLKDLQKEKEIISKESLKKIVAPTFIMHGMKDPMVAVEHPKYLQENIKGSRFHAFENGKHNLHIRFADEFVPLAEKFLTG